MLLTRLALNPTRRGCRHLLASPHRMHAAVLAAFPPTEDSHGQGRVLWRVDTDPGRRVELYLASPAAPDLTHVVEQAGWPTTGGWDTRDYTPLLDRLQAGQRWAFRLTANPTHRVLGEDGVRRVLAHVTAAQQQSWLQERVERHGFRLAQTSTGEPDVVVRDRRTLSFAREGATVTLSTATYDGTLEVLDSPTLGTALVHGIGRAKGYGCGLLTLASPT